MKTLYKSVMFLRPPVRPFVSASISKTISGSQRLFSRDSKSASHTTSEFLELRRHLLVFSSAPLPTLTFTDKAVYGLSSEKCHEKQAEGDLSS